MIVADFIVAIMPAAGSFLQIRYCGLNVANRIRQRFRGRRLIIVYRFGSRNLCLKAAPAFPGVENRIEILRPVNPSVQLYPQIICRPALLFHFQSSFSLLKFFHYRIELRLGNFIFCQQSCHFLYNCRHCCRRLLRVLTKIHRAYGIELFL